jgi:hypothetical protein
MTILIGSIGLERPADWMLPDIADSGKRGAVASRLMASALVMYAMV